MQDTSAIGLICRLKASKTYPLGIIITAYPEDSDIGPSGEQEIAGNASGINGDLIWWSVVNGIETQLGVIPNTLDEALLDKLFEANRASKNRFPKKDVITLTVINPVTGVPKTYKNGIVKRGAVGYTYGGDGRIKTKTYGFVFEDAI